MASTTSTEQSGLFSHLPPEFKKASGLGCEGGCAGHRPGARHGRRGDDRCAVCARPGGRRKVCRRWLASSAYPVMYNDFIWSAQRATSGAPRQDIVEALKEAGATTPTSSRAATRAAPAAELRYWKLSGADADKGSGGWEGTCGCGMGPALNIAASAAPTWHRPWHLAQLQEPCGFGHFGGRRRPSVQPVRCDGGEPRQARPCEGAGRAEVCGLIVSPTGQAVIASYKIGGEQLFFPNAEK